MLEINCIPEQIAAGVNERGDVVIAGVDNHTGLTVSLTIDSNHWKTAYQKMGQLRGVGIYKANRINHDLAG